MEYLILRVPFGKKDLAKKLGAHWNFKDNLWYIPKDLPLKQAKAWVIEQKKEV